jgi:threonylcarbamoyladenosine tRNA methylthiotransferase MtaB
MKISIQTLGCKVNQSESASIEGILRNNDHEIVSPSDNPDVCIINTCTVTAKSDYQSRQLVRRAVRSGAKVIATGCYAQLRPGELLNIQGLSLVAGNSAKDSITDHIAGLSDNGTARTLVDPPSSPLKKKPYYSKRSRAFLKVQDGCNFSCSYCTVPIARGKSRSLQEKDVISAVKDLVSDGYREIVITGIHAGFYGLDLTPKSSLHKIVKKLARLYTETRFRLSSIEPREFNEDFISLLEEKNVCRHIHIPLQSGSDRILRKMNRGYTSTFYEQLINRIITAYPDISIGTDIIAGHPGETGKDFNDTVNFLQKLPLSYIHVFPYSKRPGTASALMNDHVDDENRKVRVKKLIEISKEKKNAYMARHSGCILNVIVESKTSTSGFYKAISDNYLRVLVRSDCLKPGQMISVHVISLTDEGIIAQPL